MYTAIAVYWSLWPAVQVSTSFTHPPTDPPARIAQLIDHLTTRRGASQTEAASALSRQIIAEPYLRIAVGRDGQAEQVRHDVLNSIRSEIVRRTINRHADAWVKAGRIDLFVELACATEDGLLAGRAYDALQAMISHIHIGTNPTSPREPASRPPHSYGYEKYDIFTRNRTSIRLTDGEVLGGPRGGQLTVFSHSLTFATNTSHKSWWVCLIGDELRDRVPLGQHPNWFRSLIVVNNVVAVRTVLDASVLIADGDIDLDATGLEVSLDGAVIICRGSFRTQHTPGASHNLICAGGDITYQQLPSAPTNTHLYAGGRVTAGGKPIPKAQLAQGSVTEKADLSFTGIRFFELSDIGVEAVPDKGGVRITKIDRRSSLAIYGLKVGDIVTKLNDQPMTSVNEFRRHARRSVALGAGIFSVRRGDESLGRIVYFDGLLPSRK